MSDDSDSREFFSEWPDFEPPRDHSSMNEPTNGAGAGASYQAQPGWLGNGQHMPPSRSQRRRSQHWFHQPAGSYSRPRGQLDVTYTIMTICVVVWLAQLFVPGFSQLVSLGSWSWQSRPWELISSAFAHSPVGIMHILGNMLMLWILGRAIEPAVSRRDYVLSYLLCALGGSAVFVLFAALSGTIGIVVGASGAVFGLFGMLIGLYRMAGVQSSGVWVLVGINVVFDFLVPGIAWQGHLGGFMVGLGAGFLIAQARKRGHRNTATLWLLIIPICAALAGAAALTR